MLAALYPTKKALKESVGKEFKCRETSMFGAECKPNQMLTVVGPDERQRKWFANVWIDDDLVITKVK